MNKILFIAAHPDDEVLGAGGALARFIREGKDVMLLVLSDGEGSRENANPQRRLVALKRSCEILGIKKYLVKNFEDNAFDLLGVLKIAKVLEEIVTSFQPDTVFTHFPYDMNQDHQVLSSATLVATRVQAMNFINGIYFYEVPSSTECGNGQMFRPNFYLELSKDDVEKKMNALKAYESEMREFPHPRSLKAIEAKLIVRGSESSHHHAEAFQVHFLRI